MRNKPGRTRQNRPKPNAPRKPAPRKPVRKPYWSEVPEKWPGCTAVLAATGPSLSAEQLEYVKRFQDAGLVRLFGCNDLYRICDHLDVLYACDPGWWKHNLAALKNPCEEIWTQDEQFGKAHQIKRVQGSSGKGISTTPNHIHFGSNSGFQLLNLAWHFGARKFILIGYNMDVPSGKQQHFFGKHPKGLNQANNYKGFVNQYKNIQPEISKNIINCTEPSAITFFQKMPLTEALPERMIYENASRRS